MTELLAWCVFAAIPVLLVVGEIRAARKRKQRGEKRRDRVENGAILLMYVGATVVWGARLGGAA